MPPGTGLQASRWAPFKQHTAQCGQLACLLCSSCLLFTPFPLSSASLFCFSIPVLCVHKTKLSMSATLPQGLPAFFTEGQDSSMAHYQSTLATLSCLYISELTFTHVCKHIIQQYVYIHIAQHYGTEHNGGASWLGHHDIQSRTTGFKSHNPLKDSC